jgi:arabinose-5-phosphate isomerase
MNTNTFLQNMREVLEQEAAAIAQAGHQMDANLSELGDHILRTTGGQSAGKLVITGLGKSGLVGRKIAATLSSTGTPAVFMHAAEALHGDLGIVRSGDTVWAISKSGEQPELNALIPAIRRIGARLLAMTARRESSLAQAADWVLHIPVEREACPHDLAPTVSSSLTLALGDALAMALMRARSFQSEDFALYHPGGALGRRLLLRVLDVMVPKDQCPLIPQNSSFEDILSALTQQGIGMVMFGQEGRLAGILTDGDVRRLLSKQKAGVFNLQAFQVMNQQPLTVPSGLRAFEALELLEGRSSPLNVAPVIDAAGLVQGAVRLHDLLQAG